MVTVTCNCGATRKTFNRLSAKDFPDGWETDCCQEAKKAEKASEKPEMKTSEPSREEASTQASEGQPSLEPKRRGRKPKGK